MRNLLRLDFAPVAQIREIMAARTRAGAAGKEDSRMLNCGCLVVMFTELVYEARAVSDSRKSGGNGGH